MVKFKQQGVLPSDKEAKPERRDVADVAAQLRRPVPNVPDPSYGERRVLQGEGDGEPFAWPHQRAQLVVDRRAEADRLLAERDRLLSTELRGAEDDLQLVKVLADIDRMVKFKQQGVMPSSDDKAKTPDQAQRDRQAEIDRLETELAAAEAALAERIQTARTIAAAAGEGFQAMPAADGYVLYRGSAPVAPLERFDQVRDQKGRIGLIIDPSAATLSDAGQAAVRDAARALRAEANAIPMIRWPLSEARIDLAELERAVTEMVRDAGPDARVSILKKAVNGTPVPGGQTVPVDPASRPAVPMLAHALEIFGSPVSMTPYNTSRDENGRRRIPAGDQEWFESTHEIDQQRILLVHPDADGQPVLPLRTPSGNGDLILVGRPDLAVPDAIRDWVRMVRGGLPEQSRPAVAWHGPGSLPRTPVPVTGQEHLHVLHERPKRDAVERAERQAQALRRPGMTTLVVMGAVDPANKTVQTIAGPIPVAEINTAVAALDGAVSVVFLDPRAFHPNIAAALAEGNAAEVIVPGAVVQFDGTTPAPAGKANWRQYSTVTGRRPVGRRLDQPPDSQPTPTPAQFSALKQRGEGVLSNSVDGDGIARSLLFVARDRVVQKLREAGYQTINRQAVRQFVAGRFATDFDRRPDHYLAFGIGPRLRDKIVRDLAERGNTDGVAGQIFFQVAAMAFELNLGVMNADGRIAEHGDPGHPSATLLLAGSSAGPAYLPVLPLTDPAIDGRLRDVVLPPSEEPIPTEQWPQLTIDPTVAPPTTDERPETTPAPEASTAATYFTALPDGVSVAEQQVNGRRVLILHTGAAPTVSPDRWPAGFATGGVSVYFDLGLSVLTAAEAMRNFRPAWARKLTAQFLGKPQAITDEQASEIATQILEGLSFTDEVARILGIEPSPVAMHFPSSWIVGGRPSRHRIPVDANGRHTFDSNADGFRYHPVTHREPPRTRQIPGGWTLDARESNVFTVTSEPAATYPAEGARPSPAEGKSGLIIVGRPGEVVPQEVLDHIERINTSALNAEVVMLGRPMSGREKDQLSTVRSALPGGWQALPVFNGWVVGRPGQAAPDLGPAADVAPMRGSKIIWVDPTGTTVNEAMFAAIELYGALPPAMRRKVMLQPVPGTKMSWALAAHMAKLIGQKQDDTSRGAALIMRAVEFGNPPPAGDERFVPRAWTDDGAISTLRQFADHYLIYPPDVDSAEPLPEGLTNPGDGWFDVDGLDLGVWSVDTTNPREVTIAHGITQAVPNWAPAPPPAAEDVRVKIVGPANQATQAALFRLIEKWRAGRPIDIAVNGDQRWGRRILENAAIAENIRNNPEIMKAIPGGLQVIPVPAGQVFAPAGPPPGDLAAAREMPTSEYGTLLWFSGDVPVGEIIAALPDSVRDWAVIHRGEDEALPASASEPDFPEPDFPAPPSAVALRSPDPDDPERGKTLIHEGKLATPLAAWESMPMRERRWPWKPLSPESGAAVEKIAHARGVDRIRSDVRWRAVHLARARALAEKRAGRTAPAPRPASTPFSALRLANLGERDHAFHRAAKTTISDLDRQRRQLDQFLKKAGVRTGPPPVAPAGAKDASAAQHANAAVMEAIRLRLSGDADGAAAVIEANRRELVKRNNVNWVRWLADLGRARPDWSAHVEALSNDVLRCLEPVGKR
ncbi:hypothetical protein [Actinoplanes sp. NPDC049265]|uniref:hypothetical protein n=1 Tax=Actinoplanes sp. NPDC049265 TaxID=3363902 RepID=UPI00371243D4